MTKIIINKEFANEEERQQWLDAHLIKTIDFENETEAINWFLANYSDYIDVDGVRHSFAMNHSNLSKSFADAWFIYGYGTRR